MYMVRIDHTKYEIQRGIEGRWDTIYTSTCQQEIKREYEKWYNKTKELGIELRILKTTTKREEMWI